jgi:hypothetical protein
MEVVARSELAGNNLSGENQIRHSKEASLPHFYHGTLHHQANLAELTVDIVYLPSNSAVSLRNALKFIFRCYLTRSVAYTQL